MSAKRDRRSDRGSVLMEYVLLCSFTGAMLVAFWHSELYDYQRGWHDGELGLGRSTVEFYQRILGAIALPLP